MIRELSRLDGKVAMVTGAGRGIGKTTALAFAEAGAKVAICGRGLDHLNETVREIEAAGGEAIAVQADVSSETDLQNFVSRTMDRFGKIDCLVNNAGGNGVHKRYFEWSHDEFIEWIRWNLSGAYVLCQLVGKHMIDAGQGTIVNISSEAGRLVGRGSLPYGVSKAGLNHLTALIAQELAPKVRCNALTLGPIMTPALKQVLDRDANVARLMIDKVPLKKVGDPACVAMTTLFLCSEASSYITGVVLPVSGGLPGDVAAFGLPDL